MTNLKQIINVKDLPENNKNCSTWLFQIDMELLKPPFKQMKLSKFLIFFTDFYNFIQVAIETVTYWDEGFGKWNWVIIKNVFVVAFGILALIFGSKSAIGDIVQLYSSSPIVQHLANATTAAVSNATSTAN